jgi:hypothetical protein
MNHRDDMHMDCRRCGNTVDKVYELGPGSYKDMDLKPEEKFAKLCEPCYEIVFEKQGQPDGR